ncbi:hypothetical protein PF008_g6485 [Phytophthora fragariae]|uniref:Uncharacterized protein n=1 Tax=Phytophthora fragariae TaxID=53985 RepID=A0A6G0S5X1_9STRA|nr:hypothetical protein PF008_g6485 [Phytophthora fragariae]
MRPNLTKERSSHQRHRYAHPKKLAIRPFDDQELYVGLGSGFLDGVRRFERQVGIGQWACDPPWLEDVKVDLLGHYLSDTTEKQVGTWWNQLPTLQYAVERMLDAFIMNITPAQAMKLFTAPKGSKGGYASVQLRTVLMTNVHHSRADYLQHTEELAYFAQAWGLS